MSKALPPGIPEMPRGTYYEHRPEKPLRPHLFRVSDPHTGRKKGKSFAKPRDGLKWATSMLAGLESRTVANGRVAWGLAVDEYVDSLRSTGRNEKYIRTVERIGKDIADRGAGDITGPRFRELVREFIDGQLTAPGSRQPGLAMSPATRRTSLAIVRAVCHAAAAKYRVPFDPLAGLKAPKVKRELVDVMTLEEVQQCLTESMETNPYFTRFALLVYLGVRDRDEGLLLRWEDYDPAKGVIRLRYQDGSTLKTGEREIPVCSELAAILRTAPKKGPFIVPDTIRLGSNGRLVEDKTDYQRFKAFVRDAWMPYATSPLDRERIQRRLALVNRKAMRHLYARLQAATGTSLSTLQGQMGHTNISTTMIYARGSEHFEILVKGWKKGDFEIRRAVMRQEVAS